MVLWFHIGRPCVCPSISHTSLCPLVCISFPDDNVSKHQWIFTKFGMCNDIVEIWFWIANGQILSNFDRVMPEICPYFCFQTIACVKCQVILTKLGTCIDIKEICLGLQMGKFRQCMTELSAHDTIMAGYYSLTFLFLGKHCSCFVWYYVLYAWFCCVCFQQNTLWNDKQWRSLRSSLICVCTDCVCQFVRMLGLQSFRTIILIFMKTSIRSGVHHLGCAGCLFIILCRY